MEQVVARALACGIRYTVVSAIRALIPYGGDPLRGNEEAQAAAEKHSFAVRFWTVVDPRRKETYRQAEEQLKSSVCCGIKIHPVEHDYPIAEHGDALFEFANAHKAVVLTHSGNLGSHPIAFVPFLDRYTEVKLILAHLGNSDDAVLSRQVLAGQMSRTGNILIDTSSARSMYSGLIEWAVNEIGADRLVFGTDTPLYFAPAQKARIEYAEIPEEARRAILFGNAAKLLGLA
jgi:predicted TIM-barrel fold metal-dependent hydrolase